MHHKTRLGLIAILVMVCLRLTIGWHFFKEGLKKYTDETFTSAGFLRSAVGPFAEFYHESAGEDDHGWNSRMAIPREPATNVELPPANDDKLEFPKEAPYKPWAEAITRDWDVVLQATIQKAGAGDEVAKAAKAAYDSRFIQLRDFLAEEAQTVNNYQNELHRLHKWQAEKSSGDVPFQVDRIAKKKIEVEGLANTIRDGAAKATDGFLDDLRGLLPSERRNLVPKTLGKEMLQRIDRNVMCLHLAIGVLLLLGLFTRTAASAAALFLLSVVASQPFWVAGAAPTYYQWAEFFGAVALVVTGAGRWCGLDYFVGRWCRRCCGGRCDSERT